MLLVLCLFIISAVYYDFNYCFCYQRLYKKYNQIFLSSFPSLFPLSLLFFHPPCFYPSLPPLAHPRSILPVGWGGVGWGRVISMRFLWRALGGICVPLPEAFINSRVSPYLFPPQFDCRSSYGTIYLIAKSRWRRMYPWDAAKEFLPSFPPHAPLLPSPPRVVRVTRGCFGNIPVSVTMLHSLSFFFFFFSRVCIHSLFRLKLGRGMIHTHARVCLLLLSSLYLLLCSVWFTRAVDHS